MNRSRHAILVPLLAVLAVLLGLAETASAAFNPAAQNPHYGNFILQQSEASADWPLDIADPTKGNGEWIYDSASGVPAYVRQNPWTKFDPLGLQAGPDFLGSGLKYGNPGTPEQQAKWGRRGAISGALLPIVALGIVKAPVIAAAVVTNPIVAGDVAITITETATGMEGPGVPNAGDMVRLPAQAAMRNVDEIAEVAGNSARGIKQAMEEVVEQIFYRGSKPGKPVDFTPGSSDFKVDPDGFVKPTHGLSVFDNAESVSSKGFDPHKIDPSSVSEELRMIQRGKDPAHYEIVPKPDVKITPSEYAVKLSEIQTED